MQETKYLSHVWAQLTEDKGWITTILMLSVCMLLPVVGWIWIIGYETEWALLIAQGIEGPPERKNIDIVRCFKSGCHTVAATLSWCVILGSFLYLVLRTVSDASFSPNIDALGIINSLFHFWAVFIILSARSSTFMPVLAVVSLYVNFMVIASLRAAICRNPAAGYEAGHILGMIARDLNGYLNISGMTMIAMFIGNIVFIALSQVAAAMILLSLGISNMVFRIFLFLMFCLPVAIVYTLISLMDYAMVGLWMRQFNEAGSAHPHL